MFRPGELVMRGKAMQVSSEPCSHSVQTDWDRHVIMDLPARYINHSCDASVGIRANDFGAFDFFALRRIDKGQELLWDYETSEYKISSAFRCTCGASNCRGVLKGYEFHEETVRERYGNYIADYLKDSTQQ
jgi:hypothetical protein